MTNIPDFLLGGGNMGERIRNYDWDTTPLGSPENWEQSLKTAVGICLNSNFPIALYWGPDLVLLYNDAWSPIPGNKHPWSLGKPAREAWKDIWKEIEPEFKKTFEGIPGGSRDAMLPMQRHGYVEECFFDFTFTPIHGASGKVEGVFNAVIETTYQVITARRNAILNQLSIALSSAKTADDIYSSLIALIKENNRSVPFVFLYTQQEAEYVLRHSTHATEQLHFKQQFPFEKASEQRTVLHIPHLAEYMEHPPKGYWEEEPVEAVILPITNLAGNIKDYLVCGLNARRRYDDDFKSFFESMLNIVNRDLNTLSALSEERKRREALAEIDKAKTQFFTNISHEFRTPLTLLLGPLEEVLNDDKTAAASKAHIDVAYRNAVRMLKLVNTLLDFSRIESGQQQAQLSPTNIAAFTKDLTSNFRSVIEKAGLQFNVQIDSHLPPAVAIDRKMWEKIVFNLLSNAFKFTLQGAITVTLTASNNSLELQVSDTGVGIPKTALQHLFERFYRVENPGGRTLEGTGIGLSFTKELVQLHGGSMGVESKEGAGSCFTVRIPIVAASAATAGDDIDEVYVAETRSLMDDVYSDTNDSTAAATVSESQALVMIVDDNADMRHHLQTLLSRRFKTITANNGVQALALLNEVQPDLILSDVMMPEMDGIQLLQAIKNNKQTQGIPVVLLTARAGENSRIEGWETGADDYLVKPFSAKELAARIDAQLRISQKRNNALQSVYNIFNEVPFTVAYLQGPDLTIEFINKYNLELWGLKKEAVVGKPLYVARPDLQPAVAAVHARVYETGQRIAVREMPIELIKNGKTRMLYFNTVVDPVFDEHHNIIGQLATGIDVTSEVMARREIEASETRFRTLAETLPQMVWVRNAAGEIEYGSKNWELYSGITNIDEAWRAMVHPDEWEQVMSNWAQHEAAGMPFRHEVRLQNTKGEYRWHYAIGEPVKDAAGKVIRWIGTLSDIHVQKTFAQKLEQKVAERTTELVQANKELESFNYIASHDLQEPLRKIQTFVALIAKNKDNKEVQEKYQEKIRSAAERMSELVNSILHYSRLLKPEHENTVIDLNQILREVKTDFELVMAEKKATVLSDNLPVIKADPFQMRQLFSNLLSNSLKFSHLAPLIQIKASIVTGNTIPVDNVPDPKQRYVQLTFTDNGIGFDIEFKERIFLLFQRLHAQNEYSGTGIGLSIVKKVVDQHKGFIVADSEPGEGATFRVWLPYRTA